MRAVIYTRVSSAGQTDGYSLEAQHEKLVKYVEDNKGELVKVYTDPGVSAKSLKRPGIQEIISDMKQGKFDTLVIHKLDRLTRNIANLNELVEMVIKENVKLVSLSENIDTSTVNGRLMIYMLGVLAQMFREQLAEEVTKGQSVRASKGLRLSPSRPYGYDLGDNLIMTVNEAEAHAVRQIYDWFNEGCNILNIVGKLNKLGISKKWYNTTVERILSNPTYIGVSHWKSKMAPEGHYIENAHEAIVTVESFENAQKIFQQRKDDFLTQSMGDFCFTTVVKCGICGRGFSGLMKTDKKNGRTSKRKTYRCSGLAKHGCRVGTISNNNLTTLFLNFIDNFSFDVVEPQKIESGRDLAKDKKKLEKLIADSDQTRLNYSRAMGAGKLDFEMFSKLMDEEIKKCEAWRIELDVINLTSPSDKKTRKDLVTGLSQLRKDWNTMSEMQKKMQLSKLFKFIVINRIDGEWKVLWYKLNE